MLPNTSQQQPAWISASTAEMEQRTRAFVRSVYAWMFGGLLLTAFAALWWFFRRHYSRSFSARRWSGSD